MLTVGPEVIDSSSHILLSHNHQALQFKVPKEWDNYNLVESREAKLSKLAEALPLANQKVTLNEITCTLQRAPSSVPQINLNVQSLFHETLATAKVGLSVEAWQRGLHTTHTTQFPSMEHIQPNSKLRLNSDIELVGKFDVEEPVLIIVTVVEKSWEGTSSNSTGITPAPTILLLSNSLAGFVYEGEWHPCQKNIVEGE